MIGLGVQWGEITETLTPFWSQGGQVQLVVGAQVQVAVLTLTLGRGLPHLAQLWPDSARTPQECRARAGGGTQEWSWGPRWTGRRSHKSGSPCISGPEHSGLQGWLRRAWPV